MSLKAQLGGLSQLGDRVARALVRHKRLVKDFALPAVVVLAIITLFVPVPPLLISLLVIFNLALSVHVLATSLYLKSPVELTIYPALLLLTTLLRLCLSISVMRSVLYRGDAGEVIEAIGRFSAGDVALVGGVMFAAILIMQFFVVAKGSERVAEVAARFTLDAMQGKQLSIEADMRGGIITQEEARRRRADLQKESQLYGAMDGAMKFVKNDSIATIIIAFINIIAGIVVGITYKGMALPEAAHRYTILTIGDGLAASISSMLVGLSAGFVVTRITSDEDDSSLGADFQGQLFNNPKPFYIAAGLLFLLGLIPAMPNLLVLASAAVAGGGGYLVQRARAEDAAAEGARKAQGGADARAEKIQLNTGVQIGIIVGAGLAPVVDADTPQGARFREGLPKLRHTFYQDTGVLLPPVEVMLTPPEARLQVDEYMLLIKTARVDRGRVPMLRVYVNASAEDIKIFGLDGEDVRNPANLRPGCWIPLSQKKSAEEAGLTVWDQGEFLLLHLKRVMEKFAYEFVGVQETQYYIEQMTRAMPKLVEEMLRDLSLPVVAEVLRRLVQEGVSILDLKSIFDALVDWSKHEKTDPALLAEYVRISLGRQICHTYARGRDRLAVYALDRDIEDLIFGNLRPNAAGKLETLALDPEMVSQIHQAIRDTVREPSDSNGQRPVIVTDLRVRRHVRRLTEIEFPVYPVISYQELRPQLELIVDTLDYIKMRPAHPLLPGDDIDYDDDDEELTLRAWTDEADGF